MTQGSLLGMRFGSNPTLELIMSYAPILTEQQIERIRDFAEHRSIEAGEILYEPGFDTPPVYVVLSGEIRILAIGGERNPRSQVTGRASFRVSC